eukprot:4660653-Pyramimonas_sp.AAC.1
MEPSAIAASPPPADRHAGAAGDAALGGAAAESDALLAQAGDGAIVAWGDAGQSATDQPASATMQMHLGFDIGELMAGFLEMPSVIAPEVSPVST